MKNLATDIEKRIGGMENVETITHCATRLRMVIKDVKKLDIEGLENDSRIIKVIQGNKGNLQLVIGPEVSRLYEMLSPASDIQLENDENNNALNIFLTNLSAIFTPLLPILAGSGVLRGIVILLEQLGVLSQNSGTYNILTSASMAIFHFLPLMLAVTAAKRFKANPYIAMAIMGALIMPEFIGMMGDVGNGARTTFLGIPVILMHYNSTVIPALISIYVFSKLEEKLYDLIPLQGQLVFVPMISLFIMVPLTAIVFGPFGVYVGEGIASIIEWLMTKSGLLAGMLIGGVWNVFVIFGLQWAVNPIMIQNISVIGHDFIVPLTAAANFGIAGATFGLLLRTKNPDVKAYSTSSLLSIFFAGITEPAIYGVGVKYRFPLIGAIVGGAVGGAYMGAMRVKAYSFVFGGLTTIPAFVGPTLIHYVIGLALCFVVGAVVTMFLYQKQEVRV